MKRNFLFSVAFFFAVYLIGGFSAHLIFAQSPATASSPAVVASPAPAPAVAASPVTSQAVAPDIDIKNLPAWLQWLLSGLGIGGLGFWAAMKSKLVKFIRLFEDCKLFITSTINMVAVVKGIFETASPEIKNAWFAWIHAMGHLLINTGNKSLVQKGELLISHVPSDFVINKTKNI